MWVNAVMWNGVISLQTRARHYRLNGRIHMDTDMLNLLRNRARNVGQLDMWGVSRAENSAVCRAAHTATVTLPELRYHREMVRSKSASCIRTVTFTAAKKNIAGKKRERERETEGRKRKTLRSSLLKLPITLFPCLFSVCSNNCLVWTFKEAVIPSFQKSVLANTSRPPSHLFWHYTNPWTSNMVVKYLNIGK